MLTELKHVFKGALRGFDTEDRKSADGNAFKVDIMVLDEGMQTYRITMKRADADDIKNTVSPGTPVRVETLVRGFQSGLGVSFLRIMPATNMDSAEAAEIFKSPQTKK